MEKQLRLLTFAGLIFFISCGAPRIMTSTFPETSISEEQFKSQSKGNINIMMEPISKTEIYKYDKYFKFKTDYVWEGMSKFETEAYYPKDSNGDSWCFVFGSVVTYPSFEVTIENNTDHILRMSDSRIYLISDNLDPIEPVKSIGKPQAKVMIETNASGQSYKWLVPQSAQDQDGSLVDLVYRDEYEFMNKQELSFGVVRYPYKVSAVAMEQNVSNYKLLNQTGKEILPNIKYRGLLIFPVDVEKLQNPIIKFYDITVKTDAAGTPIEKVAFDFPLRLDKKDIWFDAVSSKRWVIGKPPAQP